MRTGPRRATRVSSAPTLRRPIRDGTGVPEEKTRVDSSFGVRGRDRLGSIPLEGKSLGQERIRALGTLSAADPDSPSPTPG